MKSHILTIVFSIAVLFSACMRGNSPENEIVREETQLTRDNSTKTQNRKELSVLEINHESLPAAVPVVSPERAEKLNEIATFLTTVKTTVVEGEITERSELPDPEKSDYPDCRFTAHFIGNSILSGEPCPKDLFLIIEGFEGYHVLPNNNIKPGDKVLCEVIPFEDLPEDFQSTQRADDLELFLLEPYYIVDMTTVQSFFNPEKIYDIPFSEGNEYISIFDRKINSPVQDTIKQDQDIYKKMI